MAASVQFSAFSNYSWTYAINLSRSNLVSWVSLRASLCRAHFRANLHLLVQLRPASNTPKSKESCDHDQIRWIHRSKPGYPKETGSCQSQVVVEFAPVPGDLYCGQVWLERAPRLTTAVERVLLMHVNTSVCSESSCYYSNCTQFRLQVFS